MKIKIIGIIKYPDLVRAARFEVNNRLYTGLTYSSFDLYKINLKGKTTKEEIGELYKFKKPITVEGDIRIMGKIDKIVKGGPLRFKNTTAEFCSFKARIKELISSSKSPKAIKGVQTIFNFYKANAGFDVILDVCEEESSPLFKIIKSGSLVEGKGKIIIDVKEEGERSDPNAY